MKKSDVLKQERTVKVDAQNTLIQLAKTETREFTTEEVTQFDTRDIEIKDLDQKISRAIAAEQIELDVASREEPIQAPVDTSTGDSEKKERAEILSSFSMKRALNLAVDNRTFDGVEKEVNEIALEELRSQGIQVPTKGFNVPSDLFMRADSHTVTQDGGDYGGKLVKESQGRILPTFVDRLTIEELGVNVMTGLVGDYPLHRGGEFTFENLEETAKTTTQKAQYDKRVLKPKRTAMTVAISNQLLVQSAYNVDADIRSRTTTALNKRLMLDMLNGDGIAPNCLGLLNDTDIAFEFSGSEGPLTLAKILELEGEVDDENVPTGNAIFLIHKKLAAVAKGIPVDSGSGVFLMSMMNELYGTSAVKTSLIPVLQGAASNFPLIYGDFANIDAGFWGGMNIVTDPYTLSDSNEVRMTINVHRDIMAANPQGFAVNKKLTLS